MRLIVRSQSAPWRKDMPTDTSPQACASQLINTIGGEQYLGRA
jgi:hypothetical protein